MNTLPRTEAEPEKVKAKKVGGALSIHAKVRGNGVKTKAT
jgi:hypothetical protein